MKFHVAWDAMQKENLYLKFGVIGLLILAIMLTGALTKVALREPLVIERACYSKAAKVVGGEPTDDEIKAFAKEALEARFNTDVRNSTLLSLEQQAFRDKEQLELSKQKMSQDVLVKGVEIGRAGLVVQADRVISVGDVRSAFRFPLKINVERDARSDSNPYGLVLTSVENLEKAKKE
jgi:hypothetical protein